MGLSNSIPNAVVQQGVCTSTTRPLNPYVGQTILETDTKRLYIYNGSTWEYVAGGLPLYAARVTGATPVLSAGVWTSLTWNATSYDYNSNMNAGTGLYTVPIAGIYEISASAKYSGNNNPQSVQIAAQANSNWLSFGSSLNDAGAAAGATFGVVYHDVVSLSAGNQVKILCYNGGGNVITPTSTNAFDSHFAIRKL